MAEIKEVIEKVVKNNKGKPLTSFKLIIDSATNSLEHNYYWILDFIGSKDVDKIKDTFTSSVGSGHFSEMGQKAARMQEEGMKMLGAINQVIKSITTLLYDLKEFEIRLDHYKKAKSENKNEKEGGMLALKQIWLDQVDVKRGRGSIHQMTYEMGYTTLRDAFMVCNTLEDVDKNEIVNDQVKRILKPRVAEFLAWKDLSEKELTSRFNIQKSYLKSQVETLKLYSAWAKPYLKAAEDLRMKGFDSNPALVNAFSTAMFDLVILKKKAVKIESLVEDKKVPVEFLDYKNDKKVRTYYDCMLISFLFRGVPQRNQKGDWDVVGKIDMSFDAYAINNQELDIIKKELRKSNLSDVLNSSILQEQANISLDELRKDIDHFLKSEEELKAEEQKKKKSEEKTEDINPFTALFSLFFIKKEEKKKEGGKKDEEKTEEELNKDIEKLKKELKVDNFIEKALRSAAASSAKGSLYNVYDVYKKAHGMGSTPEPLDFEDAPAVPGRMKFKDVWNYWFNSDKKVFK